MSLRNRVITEYLAQYDEDNPMAETPPIQLTQLEMSELKSELHPTERWVDSKVEKYTLNLPWNRMFIPVQVRD